MSNYHAARWEGKNVHSYGRYLEDEMSYDVTEPRYEAGWRQLSRSNWEYYADDDSSSIDYVIDLYWYGPHMPKMGHMNRVQLYEAGNPQAPAGRSIVMPDHITTIEEAQAWAVAIWRML